MANDLLIATGNAHKVEEIQQILAGLDVTWHTTKEWPDGPDPVEDGSTYAANAAIKARAWAEHTGMWTLADDSGLEVDELAGDPGMHSARYAPTNDERIAKVLMKMSEVEDPEDRTARFVCAAVLVGPDGAEIIRRGFLNGRIATEARGEGGFGYDPIFVPEGEERHLAELSEDEKNEISHRGRAMRSIREEIEKQVIGQAITD
ncbi:RdgB/HAM1 family non-canonical purine NTP pyrophosphatase [bacterium]|nr:RdgB/HAM1 family non-canonical purine NTP pyrophosphatase [bacterium]